MRSFWSTGNTIRNGFMTVVKSFNELRVYQITSEKI